MEQTIFPTASDNPRREAGCRSGLTAGDVIFPHVRYFAFCALRYAVQSSSVRSCQCACFFACVPIGMPFG